MSDHGYVETLVSQMVHEEIDRHREKDLMLSGDYPGLVDFTTEEMERASLEEVIAVLEADLDDGKKLLTDTYLPDYDDLEKALRHAAGTQLKHLVWDELDGLTGNAALEDGPR